MDLARLAALVWTIDPNRALDGQHARATVRGCPLSFLVTSLPPRRIRVTCFSGRMMPPFGKSVYAVAISYGVASNTPSAIDG